MVEFYPAGYPGDRRREEGRGLVAVMHRYRLHDFKIFPAGIEGLETGLKDRVNEGPGAAVHDGHFRAGEVDVYVIHLESGQRGKKVLDGPHLYAAFFKGGRIARVADVLRGRLDFRAIEPEYYTGPGRCGESSILTASPVCSPTPVSSTGLLIVL